MNLQKLAIWATATATLVLFAGTAVAGQSFEKLAEKLADLRSEVDSLTSEVETKKSRLQSRLRSIQRQRATVERKIEQEKSKVERLKRSVKKRKEELESERAAAKDLKPAVKTSFETVRTSVRQGPPFKREERLEQLDKLESQMNEGLLSPQKAASRLWQFVEDELRLSRENGLYSQVIDLNGDEVLADVARVGMVALYFKTDDGRVGVAERADEGWNWRTVDQEKKRRRIRRLFESFNKGIRVGYFEVPNGIRGIDRIEQEEAQ